MSYKSDLEKHLRNTYALIPQYEEIIQESDDPRGQARARQEIDYCWELIAGYLADYRSLVSTLPEDIAELAVHFTSEEAPTGPPLVLVPEYQRPPKYKGLIVVIGTRPDRDGNIMGQSATAAIEYHLDTSPEIGLQHCWLVTTGGETGSLPVAQEHYVPFCETHAVQPHVRVVGDPFNIQDTYDLVLRIYRLDVPDVGLTPQQVIADFTGGPKPISAGMWLACGDRRPMQYMYGRKPGVASVPRLIEFTPRA